MTTTTDHCIVNGMNSMSLKTNSLNGVDKIKNPSVHPGDFLTQKATMHGLHFTDEHFAQLLDEEDELHHLRAEFFYPKNGDLPKEEVDVDLVNLEEDCVYLCGNSLGLEPRGVKDCLQRELDKWGKFGVYGHEMGEMPWAHCDECIQARVARLVGAQTEEVAVMNALTVNQHLMLISFYQPTAKRHKILLEDHSFPSDHYAVESQIQQRGYDPAESMLLIKPREGEDTLRTEDILKLIEDEGDSIAVVMLPGVQYYTGQLFEMEKITKAAQVKGCYVGFDLAHAVGNVEICLHDWGVDFACWCSYKYLNAGAGAIAGVFIHQRHHGNQFPRLHGWWSHDPKTRFNMTNELEISPGAAVYRISNPSILLCASLEASLKVFSMTSMSALRGKSKLLTGYLELMICHHFPKMVEGEVSTKPYVEIITPADPEQRGAQLSVKFSVPITNVFRELKKRGVVLDKREPNVLRVAPAPMYNSYKDVFRFIQLLHVALDASK